MDNELAIRRAVEYMRAIDEEYMTEVLKILYAYKVKSERKR